MAGTHRHMQETGKRVAGPDEHARYPIPACPLRNTLAGSFLLAPYERVADHKQNHKFLHPKGIKYICSSSIFWSLHLSYLTDIFIQSNVHIFEETGLTSPWRIWGLRALLGVPMVTSLHKPWDLNWSHVNHRHSVLTGGDP